MLKIVENTESRGTTQQKDVALAGFQQSRVSSALRVSLRRWDWFTQMDRRHISRLLAGYTLGSHGTKAVIAITWW